MLFFLDARMNIYLILAAAVVLAAGGEGRPVDTGQLQIRTGPPSFRDAGYAQWAKAVARAAMLAVELERAEQRVEELGGYRVGESPAERRGNQTASGDWRTAMERLRDELKAIVSKIKFYFLIIRYNSTPPSTLRLARSTASLAALATALTHRM